MIGQLSDLRGRARESWTARIKQDKPVIFVGTASCGRAAGALETLAAARSFLDEHGLDAEIIEVGCIGPCYLEPLLDLQMPGDARISFANVNPAKARHILKGALLDGELPLDSALGYLGENSPQRAADLPRFFDLPMLKPQIRITLRNCGLIDPDSLEAALAVGAYQGFERALEMGAESVIAELKTAGLRGRGGAGFPTWRKWELARNARATPKTVVCNADEGDPGAFMNRSLIEGDPHGVLEGMLIAGWTIGASRGLLYVRAEYPLAVHRLRTAIQQLEHAGLLGQNILGSGFDFSISLREGAGAFVCGEETALIASLEGQRGTPRPRPPFPADKGYRDLPTLINNTETLGTVPAILREGGAWYQQFGTPTNPGTKTFSLAGKARHTGLIEIPLGMPLRQVVEEIGGGTLLPFKAVQTGGPLGGCLPEALLDTPITYETMRELGSIMGSGGLVVMDQGTCMVDMARFFVGFARNESCGNCTSCRNGTRLLSDTLAHIAAGEGGDGDVETLRRASDTMTRTSLCGLGQAAANPVMSSLTHFSEEYREHVEDGYCRAGVCTSLFELRVDGALCNGCTLCARVCPTGAVHGERRKTHWIDALVCSKCRACLKVCRQNAILPVPVGSFERTSAGDREAV